MPFLALKKMPGLLLEKMARLGKELGYLEIAFKCQKVKKNLRKSISEDQRRQLHGLQWSNLGQFEKSEIGIIYNP